MPLFIKVIKDGLDSIVLVGENPSSGVFGHPPLLGG